MTPDSDYKYAVPRYLHNADLDTLLVTTADECDHALKHGWSIKPVPQTVYRKGRTHLVSTPEEKSVALAHGWTEDEPAVVESKPHKGADKSKADGK